VRRAYDLASLTALVAFEAAARRASFKAAAAELNVTPAAVSHQIKALEADLGCALFRRQHRGVELTGRGSSLFSALQRGFEAISEGVSQTRARTEPVDVTIATTTAVSALWLTPRITAFWRTHPAITVSQIVSDVPGTIGRTDLTIYYGDERPGPGEDRELFRDRILAIGTPSFAEEYAIRTMADLRDAPLVHSSIEEAGWTTWDEWFGAFGQPAPKGRRLRVNNDMIALQAAQDGVGAALGWEGLIGDLLAQGRLVQLVPDFIPSPSPFRLRIHANASARARIFADWLMQPAAPGA
jgi:LysR family transcriptional regulator, glycine cleavage system transcriptional activator